MASLNQVLTFLGVVVSIKCILDLVSFISLYCRPSRLHQFLHGSEPYALITGASDGIGKAIAKELYSRGFNVILHGRNEQKLQAVEAEFRKGGSKAVKLWVADATSPEVDFDKAIKQWKDLHITLVIHNVGSARPKSGRYVATYIPKRPHPHVLCDRLDSISEKELMDDIYRNSLFPFFFTRAILPKLRQASGPAEMLYIGSLAGERPMPHLTPYGATKSFLKQFSGSIGLDERSGIPSNVSTVYVNVGSVVSNSHKIEANLFSPSSEIYAKSLVDKIGCGRKVLVPYLPHALQFWPTNVIPEWMLDRFVKQAMEEEMKLWKKD
ncbi:hypothetical protein PHLCEN_2v9606 [Hermanssonia centrifuga]|uniref:NAD(P)-binding protein n=1 Tax=Hermanssonia centrifuga TaxID=98765 RepID=A0A2R6NQA8_9APHY|nr:hypothetical protein PHLCEN_2v9606 [Hermanssonia centrifuga]